MASRANQRVFRGWVLLCAAALLCSSASIGRATDGEAPNPAAGSNFPIASEVRLAGDAKQTRFVLDLDRPIQFRAFALADPYRVIVDIPQVDFQLKAGAGTAGRGLIKAFRYGLMMPGGSRIVFDLAGPAKIANSYVLEAANGQPPRLVLELEQVDRTTFVQSLGAESRPELKPAISDTVASIPSRAECRRQACCIRRCATRGRDRSRTWRHRQRHPGRRRPMKRNWCWDFAWRCATGSRRSANTASS